MSKKDTSDNALEDKQNALKNLLVKLTTKNMECGALNTKANSRSIAKNIIDMDNYIALFRSLDKSNQKLHKQTIINMSKFIIQKIEFVIAKNEDSKTVHNIVLAKKFNDLRNTYYVTMYGESLH